MEQFYEGFLFIHLTSLLLRKEGGIMKITIDDMLKIPSGMDIDTYMKKLKQLKRLRSRITNLSNQRFEIEDKLNALSDEEGSERYIKYSEMYKELGNKFDKELAKYSKLASELGRGDED